MLAGCRRHHRGPHRSGDSPCCGSSRLAFRWLGCCLECAVRFLAESPLIFRDVDGLSAVHTDRVTPRQKLLAAGLNRLVTLRPDAAFGVWEEDRGDESEDPG